MTEQPAPYQPNPSLKRVERGFERMLFNSRWLMAPFYLGLVISLAVLLLKFCMMLWEFILHAPGSKESDIILGVLSLIDLSLTGNLILIVVFSGYENFVSKIDPGGHPDWPDWMTKIQFGGLKQKLLASIVAISANPGVEGLYEYRHHLRSEQTRLAGRRAPGVRGLDGGAGAVRPLGRRRPRWRIGLAYRSASIGRARSQWALGVGRGRRRLSAQHRGHRGR